jgi:spore coat protein U-like protein
MNKYLSRLMPGVAMLLAAPTAWSAMSCSLVSNPPQLKVIYNYFPAADLMGAVDMTCTKAANDDRRPTIWIGMTQTPAGRTATLDTGGSTIGYEIFHGSYTAGTWTSTGGVPPGSNTNGAVTERLDFGTRGGTSLTESYTFYLRVPLLQIKPVGVYLDTVPVTLHLDNANGAILGTATLPVYISIPRSCRFSTPPSGINVNYPAFSPTAVTGASNFAMTCTQGTTYTIALDTNRSVVPTVQLRYGLTLSAGSATGTAVAQPYTVNISVDPGQAGRCSGGTCTGTDTRTLTVSY